MSDRDLEILTLWETLSEREKQEVLKKIHTRAKQERGQNKALDSASERQCLPKRQLRPIWQFALDTIKVLGVVAILYILTSATLLLA